MRVDSFEAATPILAAACQSTMHVQVPKRSLLKLHRIDLEKQGIY